MRVFRTVICVTVSWGLALLPISCHTAGQKAGPDIPRAAPAHEKLQQADKTEAVAEPQTVAIKRPDRKAPPVGSMDLSSGSRNRVLGSGGSLYAPPGWKAPAAGKTEDSPRFKQARSARITVHVHWITAAADRKKSVPEFRVEVDKAVVADWRALRAGKETELCDRFFGAGTYRVILKRRTPAAVDGKRVWTVRKEHKDLAAGEDTMTHVTIAVDDKVGYFVWKVSRLAYYGRQ